MYIYIYIYMCVCVCVCVCVCIQAYRRERGRDDVWLRHDQRVKPRSSGIGIPARGRPR